MDNINTRQSSPLDNKDSFEAWINQSLQLLRNSEPNQRSLSSTPLENPLVYRGAHRRMVMST